MTQQDRPRRTERAAPNDAVVLDCELNAPPEKVWRALTDPALLAAWLAPTDLPEGAALAEGVRFALLPTPANANVPVESAPGGAIECRVLTAEPHRRLVYTWRGGEDARDALGRALDTIVTFALQPTPSGGTRLRIVHGGFPPSLRVRVGAPAHIATTGSLRIAA